MTGRQWSTGSRSWSSRTLRNENPLNLTIGGVRSYNQENLYSNVKKKATFMVYEAITDGDNIRKGEVRDYHQLNGKSYNSYSQTYVNEYGKVLFEAFYSEKNQSIPHRTVKIIRENSKNSRIQAVYEKRHLGSDYTSYTKTIYNHNDKGQLMDVVKYSYSSDQKKYESNILSSNKYDSFGNIIERIEYADEWDEYSKKNIQAINSTKKFSNYTSKGNYQNYFEYDSNNQLKSEVSFEFYPSGLIRTEHEKSYKYNQLTSDTKTYYVYDSKGKILERKMTGKTMEGWIGTPNYLNEKEREEYIKQKYYGSNLKLKAIITQTNMAYDNHNNLIYSNTNFNNDIYNDQPLELIELLSPKPLQWSYKYNKDNEWIEVLEYYQGTPSLIIEKTLTYF